MSISKNKNSFPSIFNDVMGPIMRGPSSSHTAAAHRIGTFIRQIREPNYTEVVVKFDKAGALATTYLGQGSAMGLAGGLLGIDMKDPEIINVEHHLSRSAFTIKYIVTDLKCKHPNAYQIDIYYPDKGNIDMLALSTGGGMFEIIELNGFKVSMRGDINENLIFFNSTTTDLLNDLKKTITSNHPGVEIEFIENQYEKVLAILKLTEPNKNLLSKLTQYKNSIEWTAEVKPVMPVISIHNQKLPFNTLDEMMELAEKEGLSLYDLALRYEMAYSGLAADAILKKMEEIVIVIKKAIKTGLDGTYYKDRILGSQARLINKAEQEGTIKKTINNKIIAFTSAIMEVKSSMGLIVAIPTAGSCGVVGGAIFGSQQELDIDIKKLVRAFMAAGVTGIFIAHKYTFSAEEGGCQVETGAAAAMAAAALVELHGGTAAQALNAASMALQNELGLICDPVAVRVEVPCLGKNIMAATNAFNSAIMALSGYDPVIPYEEVIDTMKSVGEMLPSSLCCTGLGGLAQSHTGKCLYAKHNRDVQD